MGIQSDTSLSAVKLDNMRRESVAINVLRHYQRSTSVAREYVTTWPRNRVDTIRQCTVIFHDSEHYYVQMTTL